MGKIKVAIIDYEMCNLFSVDNACKIVGFESEITNDHNKILEADAVILPGVGAFANAMDNINRLGLADVIRKVIQRGTPFMGICLGLQLLFTKSEEFGETLGLGIIDGLVKKFPKELNGVGVKVPQIAWNHINIFKEHSILNEIKDKEYMYFVHSFYVEPENLSVVLTKTVYADLEYCSSVQLDNVIAFQCHPEKSGEEGLKIYKNWKKIIENKEG